MNRNNFILVIAIIALVALSVNVFNVPVREQFGRVLNPIGSIGNNWAQTLQSNVSDWFNLGSYDSSEVEGELTQLRLETVELERLRQQNRQLRQELNFIRDNEFNTIQADVVTYQSDAARDVLRINVGSDDGIEADMPIVAESALVGVVDEVYSNSADVLLVTDVNFRALAEVGSQAEGVVTGGPGGSVTIDRLPQDGAASLGEVVATSGRDGTFPRGLLIGTVRSIAQEPGAVFDTAQIAPSVTYRDLEIVTVIVSP